MKRYTIDCANKKDVLVESETGYLVQFLEADEAIKEAHELLSSAVPNPRFHDESSYQDWKNRQAMWLVEHQ